MYRQPRVLPGRQQHRAAVHGRAADGARGRLLARRGERGVCTGHCSGRCGVLTFGGLVCPAGRATVGTPGARWSWPSPCRSSTPAGRPSASRWRRSCSWADSACSSTRPGAPAARGARWPRRWAAWLRPTIWSASTGSATSCSSSRTAACCCPAAAPGGAAARPAGRRRAHGVVDGVVLSWPYLGTSKRAAAAGGGGQRGTGRHGPGGAGALRTWPASAAGQAGRMGAPRGGCPALCDPLGLAIRPYVQTGCRSCPGLRLRQRAIADAARSLLQISLHWVFWYAACPLCCSAALGRCCAHPQVPAWRRASLGAAALPLRVDHRRDAVRPAIVPDQPWASRRLVPAVLPGLILLAIWAARWLIDWLRRRHGPVVPRRRGRIMRGGAGRCLL